MIDSGETCECVKEEVRTRDISPVIENLNQISDRFDVTQTLQSELTERLSMVLENEVPTNEKSKESEVESDVELLRNLQNFMNRINKINDRFKNTLDRLAL